MQFLGMTCVAFTPRYQEKNSPSPGAGGVEGPPSQAAARLDVQGLDAVVQDLFFSRDCPDHATELPHGDKAIPRVLPRRVGKGPLSSWGTATGEICSLVAQAGAIAGDNQELSGCGAALPDCIGTGRPGTEVNGTAGVCDERGEEGDRNSQANTIADYAGDAERPEKGAVASPYRPVGGRHVVGGSNDGVLWVLMDRGDDLTKWPVQSSMSPSSWGRSCQQTGGPEILGGAN